MKKYITALLLAVTFFTSCFKDKGNYVYTELAEIKVEGIPEVIEVLSKIERIVVTPKITSSKEGEIKADNPNYSFRYRLGYKSYGYLGGSYDQAWIDLTPTNGFYLDIPANFEANNYLCWLTITDKRNNTVHSHVFDIIVTTTTYQGWMVLSNIGQEGRVRLDMISHVSSTRTEVLYDIATGLPDIHNGTQISIHSSQVSPEQDLIAIFSKEKSYYLNNSTLKSGPELEYNNKSFFAPPAEPIISAAAMCVTNNYTYTVGSSFAFTDAGNAYHRQYGIAGNVYGLPINTTVAGTAPQFKVAPFAGVSEVRPGNSLRALFYDQDNKRFMGYAIVSRNVISNQQMFAIPDPATKLFSYQTGRDLVYMEGTRRSNGLVYAILQDAQGKRSIYGINVGGSVYKQESYYENVTAPGFEQATLFAFHSQFPLMFYATGNKVYLYNLATRIATEMTNVTGGEITTLQFNLFQNPVLTNLNNQSQEFMSLQFQLIVGTFDNSVANGNGGKVAFYEVDGSSNTINKLSEYEGFGKVKDVTYRERYK